MRKDDDMSKDSEGASWIAYCGDCCGSESVCTRDFAGVRS